MSKIKLTSLVLKGLLRTVDSTKINYQTKLKKMTKLGIDYQEPETQIINKLK